MVQDGRMEIVKIILLCVVAACVYGILHDMVTAQVCVEYFTIGHRPIFGGVRSPILLALGWGVIATWWVGLPLGIMAALAARVGRSFKLKARQLVRPMGILLAIMGSMALMAGIAGYVLARLDVVRLTGWTASRVPQDRHWAFIADLWAHLASYASGVLGGLVFCVGIILWRIMLRRVAAGPADSKACC